MRQARRGGRSGELRGVLLGLALYAALLGGLGYGVFAAATHPDFIAWLEPGRAFVLPQPSPPVSEKPHASLPPRLRGAMAE